jgi:hypothetical protein
MVDIMRCEKKLIEAVNLRRKKEVILNLIQNKMMQ